MESGKRPTGVLVIRAWLEGEPEPHFVARITRTVNVEAEPRREQVSVATTVEAVCAVVTSWLAELAGKRGVLGPD